MHFTAGAGRGRSQEREEVGLSSLTAGVPGTSGSGLVVSKCPCTAHGVCVRGDIKCGRGSRGWGGGGGVVGNREL